jgi:hypothetical protein
MTRDLDLAPMTPPETSSRMVGTLRTPATLRPRQPPGTVVGTVVRGARAFAGDVALPLVARSGEGASAVAELPDGVLPSGRGVAVAGPVLPEGGGALAAYAALLARKRKAPRDVPVRGLPLTVRRAEHATDLRLPGTAARGMVPADADLPSNAARQAAKPQQPQRPAAPAPVKREVRRTSTAKAARAAREAREARQESARSGKAAKAAKAASDILRAANVARAQKAARASRSGRTTNRRGDSSRDAS